MLRGGRDNSASQHLQWDGGLARVFSIEEHGRDAHAAKRHHLGRAEDALDFAGVSDAARDQVGRALPHRDETGLPVVSLL